MRRDNIIDRKTKNEGGNSFHLIIALGPAAQDSFSVTFQESSSRVENPRGLAAAFGMAVSTKCPVGKYWIAKNGKLSLFRLLQHLMPQVSPSKSSVNSLSVNYDLNLEKKNLKNICYR